MTNASQGPGNGLFTSEVVVPTLGRNAKGWDGYFYLEASTRSGQAQ